MAPTVVHIHVYLCVRAHVHALWKAEVGIGCPPHYADDNNDEDESASH